MLKDIEKAIMLIIIIISLILCLNTVAFSQDNGNNTNNTDSENENNNDDFNIDEDDLFDDEDDMIDEVDEEDIQEDITPESSAEEDTTKFLIEGNFNSLSAIDYRNADNPESPFDKTLFTNTLDLTLNMYFKLESFIYGSLDFTLYYTPSYYSFIYDMWIPDVFAVKDTVFSLDIRSTDVRAYMELQFNYDRTDNTFNPTVDELFLDINALDNSLFFRFGKQDIKWGAGYRWSPTDFLNEERIDPLDPDEEINVNGITGFKMTIPISTFNFITFIGNESLTNILDTSITLRTEYAYDFFEISATAYYQKNLRPLFGADFSGGGEFWYGIWEFWNETSFSMGSNRTFVRYNDDNGRYETYEADKDRAFFKNVFGLSYNTIMLPEQFTTSLTFSLEYFYNGEGYDNADLYPYTIIFQKETGKKLFQPYRMGKHYIAAGLSLDNILSSPEDYSELSIMSNYIINISDMSSILSLGCSYSGIKDLSLSISGIFTFAEEGTEFYFMDIYTMFLLNLPDIYNPFTQEISGYDNIYPGLFSIDIKLRYKF